MRFAALLSLLFFACSEQKVSSQLITIPYDLRSPAETIILPAVLHEISGITHIDSTTVACVQDENAIVFFLDLAQKQIKRQLVFGYDGDYEGIARAGKTLYVLRSDGALYEIPDLHSESANTIHHMTNVPAGNNEGLFFDERTNSLLIASKGKVDDDERFERHIYSFDLGTKQLSEKPAFNFSAVDVTQFAADHNLHEPYRLTSKGKTVPNLLKVRMSDLAFHPATGDLYLLAAVDHLLLVFDRDGSLRHIQKLDPVMFNQAEGITFMENGDMLICNEGGQGQPTLLRFSYSGNQTRQMTE